MTELLPIDLYHGTSTLFLKSIHKNGLGAKNPLAEMNLYALAEEIYPLCEEHLSSTTLFLKSGASFKKMTVQSNVGLLNMQHGQTYLTPSVNTAVTYAVNSRYGSEFITYLAEFIEELRSLQKTELLVDIKRKYLPAFKFFHAKPSPILIKVRNVPIDLLANEHGGDCTHNIDSIRDVISDVSQELHETYLQQCNFRLLMPIEKQNLSYYVISVIDGRQFNYSYDLYEISAQGI